MAYEGEEVDKIGKHSHMASICLPCERHAIPAPLVGGLNQQRATWMVVVDVVRVIIQFLLVAKQLTTSYILVIPG